MGPEAFASGPTPCLSACLSARVRVVPNRAPEEISERDPPLLVGSSVVRALLGDVFANDELAGCAGAELLQGEAARQLLVRRGCNLP